mmetsp:Transcript_79522/g.221265  ORF Transcript_79522/g.221265 Transcript_79522/m.221265 type:complete len:216 (+) Transcript_79522:242-889(+)
MNELSYTYWSVICKELVISSMSERTSESPRLSPSFLMGFLALPRFQRNTTGGVLRTDRTASHCSSSIFSSNPTSFSRALLITSRLASSAASEGRGAKVAAPPEAAAAEARLRSTSRRSGSRRYSNDAVAVGADTTASPAAAFATTKVAVPPPTHPTSRAKAAATSTAAVISNTMRRTTMFRFSIRQACLIVSGSTRRLGTQGVRRPRGSVPIAMA